MGNVLKDPRFSKGTRELQEPGIVSDQVRRSHVVQILPAPPRPSQARGPLPLGEGLLLVR
jgi:hypothetical protein